MKNLLFSLLAIFMVGSVSAQNIDDYMEVQREVLKTEKKAVVAEAMQFTEAESAAFWPLYNEYNEKAYIHYTDLYNLIKDYAKHYGDLMTNEKAIEIYTQSMKIEAALAKLEKSYFKKFQSILPGRKAVRYMQLENKIKALVDAELALEIPLMEE